MGISSINHFLRKILSRKIVFYVLLATVFIVFIFPPDTLINLKVLLGILFLFILPGYLFLSIIRISFKEKSLLEILIYSLITGMSVDLLLLFLLGSLGIGIPDWIIFTSALVIGITSSVKIFKEKMLVKKIVEATENREYILLLGVLTVLLAVSFLPVKCLLVAPLHDPAQNSISASKLISNNFLYDSIPLFASHYPPGVSYIVALFGTFIGVSGSKATLILTTIMAILAGFSLKIFIEKHFANKKFSNVALIFLSLVFPYVLGLYLMAGKNSQVFAYSFLIINLLMFYEALRGNFWAKVLMCLVVASSFLIHYSNIFVFLLFSLVIYLIEYFYHHWKIKDILKTLLSWLLPILISATFFMIQAVNINKVPGDGGLGNSQMSAFGPLTLINFIEYLFTPPANVFERLNNIFLVAGPVAFFVILFLTIKEFIKTKKINRLRVFIVSMPVVYLVLYSISAFKISYFSNLHVYFFIVFLFSYLIYEFINFHPSKKLENLYKYVKVCFVVVTTIYLGFSAYWLGRGNIHARDLTTVQEADIRAFDWIEENTSATDYFLPSALQGFEIKQNYETDGLLYLKAFTDREDVLSFVQGDVFFNDAELRNSYLELSENLESEEALGDFTSVGVKYIYVDSEIEGASYMNPDTLSDYPSLYELIYNVEGIKIYEIKGPL